MADRPLAFARRRERRLLSGVAGGFADAHRVDPVVVRAALVISVVAGGLGLVAYAVGFAWATEPAPPGASPDGGSPTVASPPPADRRRTAAFACLSAGGVMFMRALGLWPGDPVMLAAGIVVAGLAALGVFGPGALGGARAVAASVGPEGEAADRAAGVAGPSAGLAAGLAGLSASRRAIERRLPGVTAGRYARLRMTGGAVLLAIGLVVAGNQQGVSKGVRLGILATALTVVGVALVLGPWIARTAQEAAEERRERIRSQERAAMAAHLHDSVLQTLALIQRSAGDPRRTVTLARRQERELRAWLYGGDAASATLAAAVRAMVEDVEATYDVTVDAVVVGDRPYDDAVAGVVAAVREACVNAAKHSGAHDVSVFVEASADAVDAFVRDRGRGFDRAAVAPDRRGISESIEGRIGRLGGTVEIESATGAGAGTEVHLRVPVEAAP